LEKFLQICAYRKDNLPEMKVLNWTLQLCRGLAKIHEKAIVHRNIAPKYAFKLQFQIIVIRMLI